MKPKAIFDENVPNHLKLSEKVTSICNLRSKNKEILINVNQQLKTFEKQTRNISNKLPTNIRSVESLSLFQTNVKNHFLVQPLARNVKTKFILKNCVLIRLIKKQKNVSNFL